MPDYRIKFAPAAARQLISLSSKQQVRIASKVDALAFDPRPHGCVKLKGSEDIYRIRVGDFRILYQILDEQVTVIVVKVAHRREVYK